VLGINSRNQLAMAEAIFQHRIRERVMAECATLSARRRLVQHDTVRQGRHGRAEVIFDCGSLSRRGNHSRNSHLTGSLIAEEPRSARSQRFSPGGHRAGANRQLRRGQECDARIRRTGQPPVLLVTAAVGAGANIGAERSFCTTTVLKHMTDVGGRHHRLEHLAVAPISVGAGLHWLRSASPERGADALALERNEHIPAKAGRPSSAP